MKRVTRANLSSPLTPLTSLAAEPRGYPGSKAADGVWQRIISLMPAHENYFEPFLGHGAILLRKKPAPGSNVGSDVDAGVMSWWMRRPPSPHLTILQEDALQILSSGPAMRSPKTLVYLDPPYLRSTVTRTFYQHPFESEKDHAKLLGIIKRATCMVMLSGYPSTLYRRELETSPRAWRCITYTAMTRGGVRRECLWMNFPGDLPLHDVRWVGEGYRERERIGRKRRRWQRKFEAMAPAERQVIREALEAVPL